MYDMFCLFIGPYEDTKYLEPKTLFKEYDEMVYCSKHELKKDGIVYDIDFDQDQVILKFKRLGKKVLELIIEDDQGLWHIKTKDLDKEGKMVFKKFINSIEELYIVPYFLFFKDYLKDKDFQIINCKIYNLESRTFDEFNQKISFKDLLNDLDRKKSVLVSMSMDTGLNIDGSIGLIQGPKEALEELKDEIVKFKQKMEKDFWISKGEIEIRDHIINRVFCIDLRNVDFKYLSKIIDSFFNLISETRLVKYLSKDVGDVYTMDVIKGDESDAGEIIDESPYTLIFFWPVVTPRKFVMPYTYEVLKMIETWYNGKRVL